MATIRKRGNKWQVQIRRKGLPPLSRSFHKNSDATLWARQMEVAADTGNLPSTRTSLDSLTLAHLLARYRDEVVVRKRGRAVETYILNAILRRPLVQVPLAEASPALFTAYREQRLEEVQPTTVRRELSLMHHAFEIARLEWELPLPANPLAPIRMPAQSRPRERRLRPGELDRMMDCCRHLLMRPLILLAIETGTREARSAENLSRIIFGARSSPGILAVMVDISPRGRPR